MRHRDSHHSVGWSSILEPLEHRRVFNVAAPEAFQWIGHVTSVAPTVSAARVDFSIQGGVAARIEFLEPDIARIRVDPTGTMSSPQSPAISLSGLNPASIAVIDSGSQTRIETSAVRAIVTKSLFAIRLERLDGTTIMENTGASIAWDAGTGQIVNRVVAPAGEHYFGMGFRGGPIDRRGRAFILKNSDVAAYGELTDPLYSSTPFYYGLRDGQTYGVFLDNPATPRFDFDSTGTGVTSFGADDGELNYYVMAGPAPADVANDFAKLTGFSPLPAMWTLGYQQSRYGYYSYGEIQTLAGWFREYNIPADAFWLDLNYTDNNHLFTYHPVTYPNPQTNNAALKAMGFKLVAIVDSAVKTDDPRYAGYNAAGNFLIDANSGQSYVSNIFLGPVSWIDFSKTSAAEMYKQQLTSFLGTGIDAVWNDLNEPADGNMPTAQYSFDGSPQTDEQARNLYALLETRATYEAQLALRPNQRPFVLSRGGYAGIQRYSANWSGDNVATWDSMRVSVQLTASMGLSGQNYFGHDIGGYLGSPSAELFTRWLQFASLTPFFRNHAYIAEAYREPFQFGEPWTSRNRAAIEQRYRLLPYIYTLAKAASTSASPIVSPTMFHFPSDPNTYGQDGEFMLGPSVLVAPVFTQGATVRTVYLPSGTDWVDYHTDQTYAGGQSVTVSAPIDRIPMFVKAGTILPSGPVRQYIGDPNVSDRLSLDIYLKQRDGVSSASFDLYEDDGSTFNYQSGAYRTTRITAGVGMQGTAVTLQKVAGKLTDPARPVVLSLHDRPGRPQRVRTGLAAIREVASSMDLESAVTDAWYFRASDRVLMIKLVDPPESVTVIVDQRTPFAPRPVISAPAGRRPVLEVLNSEDEVAGGQR